MKETKRTGTSAAQTPAATTTTTTTTATTHTSSSKKGSSSAKTDTSAVSKTTSTGTIDSPSSAPTEKAPPVTEVPAPVQYTEPPKETAVPVPEEVDVSKLDTVSALYNYTADEEGELTFKEGDTIYVISKDPSGWWRGRTVAGDEGDFPSNYVGVQGAGAAAEVKSGEEEADEEETTVDANYRVLYDYEAEEDGELTIAQDQVLFVFTERGGWFYGRNEAGQTGLFPSNYVERVEA